MSGSNNFSLPSLKDLYPYIYHHARAAVLAPTGGVSPDAFIRLVNDVVNGRGSSIDLKTVENTLKAKVPVAFGQESLTFSDLLDAMRDPARSPDEICGASPS